MDVIVRDGSVSMGVNSNVEGDGGSDDESDLDMGDGGPAVIQRPISKHSQRRTINGTLIPRVVLIGSITDQDNGKLFNWYKLTTKQIAPHSCSRCIQSNE